MLRYRYSLLNRITQRRSVTGRFFSNPHTLAIPLSFLLSTWAVYTKDAINNDGIVYVGAAEKISSGDWAAAYELYNWLFFPYLIALISHLFEMDLESSAQLLDAAFAALLATTFISLVETLGGNRKTQFIAALVILFHPYLNEFRAEIFRDHGYWACYLVAVLFFIRFYCQPGWGYGLGWGFAMALGSLFRIEGVVLILLLPMVVWLRTNVTVQERARQFLMVYSAAALMAIGLLLWIAFDSSFRDIAGRLYEPIPSFTWNKIWIAFAGTLEQRADLLAAAILNRYSEEYALLAVIATLIVIVLAPFINTLTPLYTLLPMWPGLRAHFRPPSGLAIPLVWLVLINLVIVFAFAGHFFFLSSRHIVPLMLIFLLVIPFILTALHDRWQLRRAQPLSQGWLFTLLLTILIYMTADGLVSVGGASKSHIREAGYWLRDHVPPKARLYTNDRKLVYYSGRSIDWKQAPTWPIIESLLHDRFWEPYNYLALVISRKTPQVPARLNKFLGPPVATFSNRKKDSVVIYRVPDVRPET